MTSKFGSLVIVALGLVPQLAHADEDAGAAKHTAVVAAVKDKTCVPPPKVRYDKKQKLDLDYSVTLGVEGGALVACASKGGFGAVDAPFACWTVDPKTNALTVRPLTMLPGRSYRVESACALGYCRPKQKPVAKTDPDAADEILAIGVDGGRVASVDAKTQKVGIFDAKTKAFQREFAYVDDKTGGMGFEPADLAIANDVVFTMGYAAGPDGGVWAWRASTGAPLGGVGASGGGTGDEAGYVNVSSGSYGFDDPTHFTSRDGGFNEATIDTTTGKTTLTTLPKPAPCTQEAFNNAIQNNAMGELEDKPAPVPAKCKKAIAAAQKTLWKPDPARGFIPFDGKSFHLRHDAKPALLVLAPGAAKAKATALQVCKIK